VDIAECEEQDEGQRSNRAQAGARRNSSGSLAMLAAMRRASSRVRSLAPTGARLFLEMIIRRVSERMRRPVKQFELSGQHRDTHLRLGAPEIRLKCV